VRITEKWVGKDDHSLAFVDTKKVLDSTGVGQNWVSNGGDRGLLEGVQIYNGSYKKKKAFLEQIGTTDQEKKCVVLVCKYCSKE
jgi:hypothetical protein